LIPKGRLSKAGKQQHHVTQVDTARNVIPARRVQQQQHMACSIPDVNLASWHAEARPPRHGAAPSERSMYFPVPLYGLPRAPYTLYLSPTFVLPARLSFFSVQALPIQANGESKSRCLSTPFHLPKLLFQL
jgi:hypothetical protein